MEEFSQEESAKVHSLCEREGQAQYTVICQKYFPKYVSETAGRWLEYQSPQDRDQHKWRAGSEKLDDRWTKPFYLFQGVLCDEIGEMSHRAVIREGRVL